MHHDEIVITYTHSSYTHEHWQSCAFFLRERSHQNFLLHSRLFSLFSFFFVRRTLEFFGVKKEKIPSNLTHMEACGKIILTQRIEGKENCGRRKKNP